MWTAACFRGWEDEDVYVKDPNAAFRVEMIVEKHMCVVIFSLIAVVFIYQSRQISYIPSYAD